MLTGKLGEAEELLMNRADGRTLSCTSHGEHGE